MLWAPSRPVPKAAEAPLLEDVRFSVVKMRQPELDGYNWLHGPAIAWHNGVLHASFGHNTGSENTATEVANGRNSPDGGRDGNRNSAELAVIPIHQLAGRCKP